MHRHHSFPPRLVVFITLTTGLLFAGNVFVDSHHSGAMKKPIAYLVIVPNTYERDTSQGRRFPVVYLLHCAGCDRTTWLSDTYGTDLDNTIDSASFIVVAPSDGSAQTNRFGWWLDSPANTRSQFSTFLAHELKPHIDSTWATIPDAAHTGIAGHSMGGFGALHNLIAHPDVFGAAFSIKGAIDITRPHNKHWPGYFNLDRLLGRKKVKHWERVNILKGICSLRGKSRAIGFYSGLHDSWFLEENRRLDALLDSCSIPHFYREHDETHFGVPDSSWTMVRSFFDSAFAGERGK